MRRLFAATTLLIATAACPQSGEFTVHPNGYIYSEAAMAQLHRIVDSLNLRFRACPVDRVHHALPHARARHVSFDGPAVEQMVKDMAAGATLAELQQRYPGLEVRRERMYAFPSYLSDGDWMTRPIAVVFGNEMSGRVDFRGRVLQGKGAHKGKWFAEVSTYDKKDYLEAFLLTEEPVARPLPERYGRLVQYVDCLIDTTQRIYTGGTVEEAWGGHRRETKGPANERLERMIDEAVTAQAPEWNDEMEDKQFAIAYDAYTEQRANELEALSVRPTFASALSEAVAEARTGKGSGEHLEEMVSRFGNKADALSLKRQRIVYGMCSMDQSPREHARAIASLAAETVNWDIFLRAHLDILNDNFRRASDGSYAQAGRQTYVAELEDLGIAVPDLLLGTLLHTDHPSSGHYRASANRTGRAVTESKEAEAIAQRMLDMIADPELDLYNRAVIYYAYLNYNGYLKNEAEQAANEKALKAAMAGLPDEVVEKRKER